MHIHVYTCSRECYQEQWTKVVWLLYAAPLTVPVTRTTVSSLSSLVPRLSVHSLHAIHCANPGSAATSWWHCTPWEQCDLYKLPFYAGYLYIYVSSHFFIMKWATCWHSSLLREKLKIQLLPAYMYIIRVPVEHLTPHTCTENTVRPHNMLNMNYKYQLTRTTSYGCYHYASHFIVLTKTVLWKLQVNAQRCLCECTW